VRGGTDITGFGFLGHALEMANASGVKLHIAYSKLPLLSGARGYAEKGIFPGGAFDNKMHFEQWVKFSEEIDEPAQMLMFDPQTSGGLLFGVPAERLTEFEKRAQEMNQRVWVIGDVRSGSGAEIEA
jgi:selenide,water dikinase